MNSKCKMTIQFIRTQLLKLEDLDKPQYANDLANVMGISASSISAWKRGRKQISPQNYSKVEQAVCVMIKRQSK